MTKKIIRKVPFIFLLFQIAAALYLNITKSNILLDFDSSLALRHAVEIWKNKQLVLANFEAVSSLEIDCVSFFAAPIYMATSNLGLSYGIIHLIMMSVMCLTVFDIFKNAQIKQSYACLANILLLTPYACGQLDYYNMLFISAGQYEFKIITMLLCIDILLMKKFKTYKNMFVIAVFFAFLGLTTLSAGKYVLITVLLPVIVYMTLSLFTDKKMCTKNKIILYSTALIFTFAVLYVRKYYFGAPEGRNQTLCSYYDFKDNLLNCITSIFVLTGGIQSSSETAVFSLKSITTLIKLVFFVSAYIFEIYTIRKYKLLSHSPLVRLSCIVTALQLFILCVTNTKYGSSFYEYRYHIVWITQNFICCVYCLYTYFKNNTDNKILKKNKKYLLILISAALLSCNLYGFDFIRKLDDNVLRKCESIIDMAHQNNTDKILFYSEDEGMYSRYAHIIRALDINSNALRVRDTLDKAQILDFYYGAADSQATGPSNLLVTDKDNFKKIPSEIRKEYKLIGSDDNDDYYITDNSKWDLQAGFPEYLDTSDDCLTSPGYVLGFDSTSSQRTAEAELKAPSDSYRYLYDITVSFDCDGKDKKDNVISLEGSQCSIDDTDEDGTLTLENIDLVQGETVKFNIRYGMKTDISKITFTRKPR